MRDWRRELPARIIEVIDECAPFPPTWVEMHQVVWAIDAPRTSGGAAFVQIEEFSGQNFAVWWNCEPDVRERIHCGRDVDDIRRAFSTLKLNMI